MCRFLVLLLLPVLSFAQSSREFELKGKLNLNKPVDWLYLRYYSGDESKMDSTQPKDNKFKFNGTITEPLVATLIAKFTAQGNEKPSRQAIQLFLEPTKMQFTAKDSLENHNIKGSVANDDFTALVKQKELYDNRLESLYDIYDSLDKAKDKVGVKRTDDAIKKVTEEMNESVYAAFVKAKPASMVALYAVKQFAGPELDPAKTEPLYNLLPETTRSLPSAKALVERIEIAKKTAVGKYAMDFTQNDTLGNPVSLSSFKGKYVLVDFWASWCGPCRRENPNVVKAFNKFSNKNFTILSVSLDRPGAKEKWLAAIHKDGLTWNHVSDLKFWDNAVAKKYGIRAIPQNLLLDPEGKIIAKNLEGEGLELKLGELIK